VERGEPVHGCVRAPSGVMAVWGVLPRTRTLHAGWTDVDLSATGEVEAVEAGKLLKEKGFEFDVAYTSVLRRAIRTLWSVLRELHLEWLPVTRLWRLNERHYGALQVCVGGDDLHRPRGANASAPAYPLKRRGSTRRRRRPSMARTR
jgi:hypothetical protein